MKPPLGQERTCSTVKVDPQSHDKGIHDGVHPYLSANASVKAPLCREKPNSSIGKAVSQFEAPLSLARSIALLLVTERVGFRCSAACAACWRLCWRIVDLAVIWSARHSYRYSSCCLTINFTRGSEINFEAEYSRLQFLAGLRRPKPPSLAGRAKSSRSESWGGGVPVRVGMNSDLMVFSRSSKWLLRLGWVRDK